MAEMASYIYILGDGADPGSGGILNDPLFGPVPTMGACRPDLRRQVEIGDWIFAISGRKRHLQQYVLGGLRVAEKIDALAAYHRVPQNRLQRNAEGKVTGNIPVNEIGHQHPLDRHPAKNFEQRARNYILGDQAVANVTPAAVAIARAETLPLLAEIHEKAGNRPIDIVGRARRLSDGNVEKILSWFDNVHRVAHG
jgi:hypothetical protein